MTLHKNTTSKKALEEALSRMDFFTAWFTDSTKPNDMEACNAAWKESQEHESQRGHEAGRQYTR